ncbi:MAG: hypothetical protein HY551_05710 [Elusimicrobia bacterium]|nr:hypothetical protein [Elusimicrobiota bacterium]
MADRSRRSGDGVGSQRPGGPAGRAGADLPRLDRVTNGTHHARLREALEINRRGSTEIAHPDRDWTGRPIRDRHSHVRGIPSRDHTRIIGDFSRRDMITDRLNRIYSHGGRWGDYRPGRYYWHYDYGYRYCHYYDHDRVLWVIVYVGDVPYCFRYHSGCFWRYHYDWFGGRWVCLENDYWVYRRPIIINRTVVEYRPVVYVDNGYYDYNRTNSGVVLTPEARAGSESAQASEPASFYSEDGTRLVQIYGTDRQAFLSDPATPLPFSPLYLAKNVKDVEFTQTSVILNIQDGSRAFFSNDRTRYVTVNAQKEAYFHDVANPPTFDKVFFGSFVDGITFSEDAAGNLVEILVTYRQGKKPRRFFDRDGYEKDASGASVPTASSLGGFNKDLGLQEKVDESASLQFLQNLEGFWF